MIVMPFLENHICLKPESAASSSLRREELGLGLTHQLNQKALRFQDLWSAREFFHRCKNVLRCMWWKWDYLACHFAMSDTVKRRRRQGLWKLWGRDENFKTVMSVIHCDFGRQKCTQLWMCVCVPREPRAKWSLSVFPRVFKQLFSLKIKMEYESGSIRWRRQTRDLGEMLNRDDKKCFIPLNI